jgi:hypothetical protein
MGPVLLNPFARTAGERESWSQRSLRWTVLLHCQTQCIVCFACASQVTSGQMAALGLPIAAMNLDAEKLIDTYGKTWWVIGHRDCLVWPSVVTAFHGWCAA